MNEDQHGGKILTKFITAHTPSHNRRHFIRVGEYQGRETTLECNIHDANSRLKNYIMHNPATSVEQLEIMDRIINNVAAVRTILSQHLFNVTPQ